MYPQEGSVAMLIIIEKRKYCHPFVEVAAGFLRKRTNLAIQMKIKTFLHFIQIEYLCYNKSTGLKYLN